MIPAVAAQMMNDVVLPDVPPGALVHANFVSGIYWDGTAMVAASEVIDIPGQVTASGLEIEDAEANLLGDFLAAALTLDWTVVVTYEHTFDSGDSVLFVVSNVAGDELIELHRDSPGTGRRMLCEESGASELREVIDSGPFTVGIHRVALTRTAGKLVMSVDGNAIVSDTSAMDFATQAAAALGGYPGFGSSQWLTIRSFTIYPAADDGDLPGLSAI